MDRRIGIAITPALGAVAFIVLLLNLWWMTGEDSRAASRRNLAAAVVPDVVPARRIALIGDIAIIGIAGNREPSEPTIIGAPMRYRPGCEALCAAILAMPRVTSVTVTAERDGNGSTRFRLVLRRRCRGATVRPQEPDRLNDPYGYGGTQETAWSLRLSTRDCIVADTPTGRPDVTIAFRRYTEFFTAMDERQWSLMPRGVWVERLEVTGAGGVLLYRHSHAATETIGRPLRPGIVNFTGLITPVFGWHRVPLTNDGLVEPPDPDGLILAHTDLHPMTTADLSRGIRARIAEVIADPAVPADDPAFDLVDSWLRALAAKPVDPTDRALVIALIGDRRVTDFRAMWDVTRRLRKEADALREPILRRIDRDGARVDEQSTGALRALAGQLPLLPRTDRTFALEQAILRDPQKRRNAKGLIIIQADHGAAAVPMLLRILREHAARSTDGSRGPDRPYEREPIDGVQVALCRIGPAARTAVPEIRRMTAAGLFPSFLLADRNWQVMLARIGTPLREIRKPPGLSGTQAEFEARLATMVQAGVENGGCEDSGT